MNDPTWKCTCGDRHTGHADSGWIGHKPVSPLEYRFAIVGKRLPK